MNDRRLMALLVAILGLGVVFVITASVLVRTHLRRPRVRPETRLSVTMPRRTAPITIPTTTAFPGKPLPSGAKVYTEQQYGPVRLAYYRKRQVSAYRQFGRHSPAWDAPVRDFLDRTARNQAEVEPHTDPQVMLLLARRLVATGCTDPVALTQAGVVLVELEAYEEGKVCLEKAAAGFAQSPYPAYCRVGTAVAMAERKDVWGRRIKPTPPTEEELTWLDKANHVAAAAAQAKWFAPPEQRVYWGCVICPELEQGRPEARRALVKALQAQPGLDPWLLQMALGQNAVQDAWEVRGSGWASEVKPEAWPEFKRGLEKARKHLEQAYKLHPEYPEAATSMITVAKAQGGAPRDWFDRAVAGQFDYAPAYRLMVDALLPRWGGSHGEMLRFAHECLDTGRFDTCVPMIYADVTQQIAKRDEMPEVFGDPQVWQDLSGAYEGRATRLAGSSPARAKLIRTNYVLLSWRTGHLDSARQQLEALGGQLDRRAFDAQTAERPEVLVASVYADSDQQRDAIKQAEQAFQSQQGDQARRAFSQLLKREQEPHIRAYLRDRLQVLQWEREFHKGQWVDLLPTEDLSGWEVARGQCTALPDGKGLQVIPDDGFALVVNHIRPSIHYELTCEVEFPAEPVPGIRAGFAAEVALTPAMHYDGCSLRREHAVGSCGTESEPMREWPLREVPQQCQLQLVKEGDQYTLRMNGQTVFESQRMGGNGTPGTATIGLGGEGWPNRNKPVLYRNLRIHRT